MAENQTHVQPVVYASREEKKFKWKASRQKFHSESLLTGPPGCTTDDFAVPQLRKCPFDLSSISFIKTIGKGHDGYCWLVKFGEEGPFVLKVFRRREWSRKDFAPRRESQNATFLQMMEAAVSQGQVDGKPPLIIKEPSSWLDTIDNINGFSDESRLDPESTHKWATENNLELEPVLSAPRLRKCHGWLKIGSQMLDALPKHTRPSTVVVDRKDKWRFETGQDDQGNDLEYYAHVYEYIPPGDNDPAEVQKVLDFLQKVGFTHCGSPCGHNWQSSVLLDLCDISNPYEEFWHYSTYCRGMNARLMLR